MNKPSKSLIGMQSDIALLKRLGLSFEILESGCCGMAGAFGFGKHKYAVPMKIGERALLPAGAKQTNRL